MKKIESLLFILLLSMSAFGATYKGKDIDGKEYKAWVYSYDQSAFYSVGVVFDGDECTIKFQKGGSVKVTLDDEEIEDAHAISAYDYKKSAFWDIDLVDFK